MFRNATACMTQLLPGFGLGLFSVNPLLASTPEEEHRFKINSIQNWQSGWLPPVYQGTRFRSEGLPLLNLKPREELPASARGGSASVAPSHGRVTPATTSRTTRPGCSDRQL